MSCLEAGTLRAFVDGELEAGRRQEVDRHLDTCRDCQLSLAQIGETFTWTASKLAGLEAVEIPVPSRALARVRQRVAETRSGRSGVARVALLFDRHYYRVAAVAAAVLLAFSVALAYPPVRSTAEGFLSVFRVQKFESVSVNLASLPKIQPPTDIGQLAVTREPKVETVASIDEARKRVDFPVRVPGALPASVLPTPSVMVSGPGEASLTVDLKKVNAYLASIGATNVNLPASLDGAVIKATFAPYVGMIYGDKMLAQMKDSSSSLPSTTRVLFVAEGRSPTVEVPANVDLDQVRSQLLKTPGLPPELVAQISAIQDWRQTFLVPVIGGTSRDVNVDGATGLLVTSREHGMTVVLWQRNDVLYAVGGNIAESEILAVANSLR